MFFPILVLREGLTLTRSPSVGEKIRALRLKLGMTQQDLAGNDFTKSFISQIEKNHARPSLKSLQIIADRLGKPISYFLDEDYTPQSTDPDKIDHLILLASHLEQEEKIADAINYYKEALSLADKTDYRRRGQLFFYLAKAYLKLGQTANAGQTLELAGVELKLAGDWELLAYAYNTLGDLQLEQGDVKQAVSAFEKALEAAEHHLERLPELQTMTLTNLGIAYARSREYAKARQNLLKALAQSESTRTYYKYGDICMALGYIDFHQENLESAYKFTTRAWHFYTAVESKDMQIQCQINLGSIQRARGEFESAEQHLLEAADRARSAGLLQSEAHAYEELARVYLAWQPTSAERAAAAEEVLHKALELSANDKTALQQLLAEVYIQQHRVEEAVDLLLGVADMLKEAGTDHLPLADVYSRLGELYQQLGDTERATAFFQQSVNLFRKSQFKDPAAPQQLKGSPNQG